MAPSASKQKRLAEKAAKQAAKAGTDPSTSTSTPNGSTANTPLTSVSAATSQDDLTTMAKLKIATERSTLPLIVYCIKTRWLSRDVLYIGVRLVCLYPI